jgi:hypothetical protein
MHSKMVLPVLILLAYLGNNRDIQAQGIPQACINLNNNIAGDWYESQGTDSQLFPSHIRFTKQGPANGRFDGFGSPGFYSITEDCDAILVTDGLGRLIVAWGAQLGHCSLQLENWSRERLYCRGGPGQCSSDCPDCSSTGTLPQLELQSLAINQDNPRESTFSPLSGSLPVVYGGSIASTSDNLRLIAEVKGCPVAEYSWSVTGSGASNYRPPSPSPAAKQWDVGDIRPITGRMTFKCKARLKNGRTVEATKDFEVGIRTDDVLVIGWINPSRVPLPIEGVEPWLTDRLRIDGASMTCTVAGLPVSCCVVDTIKLAQNITTLDNRALSYVDRLYILQWMFRFAANWDSLDSLAKGFTDSDGVLSELKVDQFLSDETKYKLTARLQIKYQVSGKKFKGTPVVINEEKPRIGITEDPCGSNGLFPGQAGLALTLGARISQDRVVMIVDGSHDETGVAAVNTLLGKDLPAGIRPKFWEDIGARITFTPTGGTSPQVIKQPYPTYYEYRNGVLYSTAPKQPESPTVNFWLNPYPFGTAKCVRSGGITPGGRCGSMFNAFGKPARDKTSRIPPYVAGFVKRSGMVSEQTPDLPDYFDSNATLVERVLAASDLTRSLDERLAAFRSLWRLTVFERENGFRQLVTGDEVVAVPSAKELIRSHADNIGTLVGQEIVHWSEAGQLALLEVILEESERNFDTGRWHDIPRSVLRHYLSRSVGGDVPQDSATTAQDVSALILAKSEEAEDQRLLLSAARLSPQSRGIWLGIAEIGRPGEEVHALASLVYSNERLPLVTRVAAALAIAPNDLLASDFAATEITRYISMQGTIDQPTMGAGVPSHAMINEPYILSREQLRLIGLLRFAEAGWEEELILKCLDSTSGDIRMTAALVGGIRWPKEILRMGRGLFTDEEYTSVLAAIAMHHPDLIPEIERRYPLLSVNEALVRLQRVGMTGVFGLPGSTIYGL